ncbi:MAG: ABC transporter permease [Chloroflexota bacterium]
MIITKRAAIFIDFIVLLALWAISSVWLNKSFLPDPATVAQTFFSELSVGWKAFQDGWLAGGFSSAVDASRTSLLGHSLRSIQRMIWSVLVGTLLATPLAILSAESRILQKFLSPLIYFLYPVPKIVFLPIIIFIFGLGDPSINFLIGLIVFFQIFVIVGDAAAQVPAETLDSIQSLGANRWHMIRHVYWPVSLPAVITALKVSIGTAIAVLFIAESIGNNVGLGYYIVVEQWNRFAYDKVYAGIIAISLIGAIFFGLLSRCERWLTRWAATRPYRWGE